MTTTLKPTNFAIAFLFLALAFVLLASPKLLAPSQSAKPVAAILHFGDGKTQPAEQTMIYFADYPEEWHESDCGLAIYLRILQWRSREGNPDPCTIFAISWQEVFNRAAAILKKKGITIELPNGLSKEAIYALGQRPEFVAAVQQVLNEIAKSQGLGKVPIYLSEFPWDAIP